MVGCLGNVTGHVKEEDPEGEKHDNPNLNFLSWGAEENGQQQYRRQNAGQNDVHDVKCVTSTHVHLKQKNQKHCCFLTGCQ